MLNRTKCAHGKCAQSPYAFCSVLCSLAFIGGPGLARAAVTTYSSQSTFLSAASQVKPTQTLNFDSLPAPKDLTSGSSLGGITFTYSFSNGAGGNLNLLVQTGNDPKYGYYTTSPDNYLTLDYAGSSDQLISTDNFTMTFPANHGIGLYFISSANSNIAANSFTLTTSSGSATNVATPDANPGGVGVTDAYFVGLLDSSSTFTSATVTSSASSPFFFYVDDISTDFAPEPGAGALLLLTLCVPWRRWRKNSPGARPLNTLAKGKAAELL